MSGLQQLADATASFTGLAEEHEDFRESVRSFVEHLSPETRVRHLMEDEQGHDPRAWRQMADQLGLQGLALPERYGGSGASFLELGVVLEEMGRAVMGGPFFSTVVLAANALLHSGDEQAKDDFLPGIAAGETIATVAIAERSGSWRGGDVEARAVKEDGIWRLSGVKSFVLDGHVADLLLVFARTGAGLSLFAVYGQATGVTRTPLPTMDQTRKQAVLEFDRSPARLVGAEGGAEPLLERVLALAAAGLAAEQVGGAQRCLEMSVEYAKVRTQFGRLIGSFQAIKHKCADMLMAVETARSAAHYALFAAGEDLPELPVIASLAKAYCSEAYTMVAAENVHVHGGIGFTWEHPAHLYVKRAMSSALLFGDPDEHRARYADGVGL
ncbi:acyl-CoA/acyl-ACP dehydrogenase [Nonomuraea sp. MCN248]|uniref:Acyl-CoA/acyl-ACP dehydrogenase n=1 Tax=Nonomuraea corallina TaxID=2989783 RepID=A0ABT4SLK2_9ACTN|nr:acyl-CoA dehydrogenase family protein [Nonomuraea corallina]MDA0638102.1 acyl-CoA/acyl-ACP dehydrogenase [Nonomuraea corallina]